MKKIFIILIAIVFVFAGCQTNEPEPSEDETVVEPTDEETVTEEPTPDPTPEPTLEPTPVPAPLIQEGTFQLPFTFAEENGIILSLESAEEVEGVLFTFKGTNNTEETQKFMIYSIEINNCMINLNTQQDIAAGETMEISCGIPENKFIKYGVEELTSLSVVYGIYEASQSAYLCTYTSSGSHVFESSAEENPIELENDNLLLSTDYIDVYFYSAGLDKNGEEYYELLLNNTTDEEYTIIVGRVGINSISALNANIQPIMPQSVTYMPYGSRSYNPFSFFKYTDSVHSIMIDIEKFNFREFDNRLDYAQSDILIMDDTLTVTLPEHYENVIYDNDGLKISAGDIITAAADGVDYPAIEICAENTGDVSKRVYVTDMTVNSEQVEHVSPCSLLPGTFSVAPYSIRSEIELLSGSNEVTIELYVIDVDTEKAVGTTVTFTVNN